MIGFRIFYSSILILLVPVILRPQNLAINGGHEIYIPAPSVPDPSNLCFRELYAVGAPTFPNQPLNPLGIASASATSDHLCKSPRSGDAHGGFFHIAGSKFENLEYQLCAPLIPGESYEISVWLSLGNGSGLAADQIGFWFTDWGYFATNGMVEAVPDFRTPELAFYTSSGYEEIAFPFQALSDEDALVLGNFFNTITPSGSNTIKTSGGGADFAYYYADDLVIRPVPRLVGPTTSCVGETVTFFLANRPECANPPPFHWVLSNSDTVILVNSDTLHTILTENTLVTAYVQEDTLLQMVTVITQPDSLFDWPVVHYLCPGEPLQLNGAFGGQATNHQWNTGETTSAISVMFPGEYTLTFKSGECLYTRTTNVILLPDWLEPVIPDTVSICPGELFTLYVTPNPPFVLESSSGQLGDTLVFTQPGNYVITTSPPTCVNPWSRTLYISDKSHQPLDQDKVPNLFTPNGDNTNDFFGIPGLEAAEGYSLNIYNRWGIPVFQSMDPFQGWDGKKDGQPLPADVYAYRVEGRIERCGMLQSILLRGDLTLIR